MQKRHHAQIKYRKTKTWSWIKLLDFSRKTNSEILHVSYKSGGYWCHHVRSDYVLYHFNQASQNNSYINKITWTKAFLLQILCSIQISITFSKKKNLSTSTSTTLDQMYTRIHLLWELILQDWVYKLSQKLKIGRDALLVAYPTLDSLVCIYAT